MKYAILIISLLLIFVIAFPQKKFEGTIVYIVHDNEGKGDHELTVLFGKPGIKIKFREKNEYDSDVLLINLDSAAVYTLNASSKTFTKKKLVTRQPKGDVPDRIIAGYHTKPIDISNQYSSLAYVVGPGGNFVLYTSDSLFYPVPDKYSINPELIIVNDNYIVLGADVVMTGMPFGMDAENDTIDKQKTW